MVQVVLANSIDLAKLPFDDLLEGYYIVGSGNTGAAAALGTLGLCYLGIMTTAAFTIRRPSPEHLKKLEDVSPTASQALQQTPNVPASAAMRTPQFGLLATSFFCLATGGVGLFSVAKPMMTEVFSSSLPSVVTASFASSYLLLLSAANLGGTCAHQRMMYAVCVKCCFQVFYRLLCFVCVVGRIGWASVSDWIGRRNTFHLFTAASIPLYLCIPSCVQQVCLDYA